MGEPALSEKVNRLINVVRQRAVTEAQRAVEARELAEQADDAHVRENLLHAAATHLRAVDLYEHSAARLAEILQHMPEQKTGH